MTTERPRRDCQHKRTHHEHGTWLAYASDDCRCIPCTAAHVVYSRDLRKRRYLAGGALLVDGTGTARRLQALAVLGFGSHELAAEYGHASECSIEVWRRGVPLVGVATARRVREMYERLWNQQPTRGYIARTTRWAKSMGWAPPLAWDDDSIDDPAAQPATNPPAGDDAPLDDIAVHRYMRGTLRAGQWERSPERLEAIRRLAALHYSDEQIGERVGLTRDAVLKTRARNGIDAGLDCSRRPA